MKIKVKFIQDSAGIEKGTIKELPKQLANEVVNLGYAELVKEEEVKPKPTRTRKAK